MSLYQLVVLIASNLVVAGLAVSCCRHVYIAQLDVERRRRHEDELESVRILKELCEVRSRFKAVEAQLIYVQLLMEQTQERLVVGTNAR